MIYGLNFGLPDIPSELRKKFKVEEPIPNYYWTHPKKRPIMGHLVGVASTTTERDRLLLQANNTLRLITVVPRWVSSATAPEFGGTWYGIYSA